jgi:hypothetical protein
MVKRGVRNQGQRRSRPPRPFHTSGSRDGRDSDDAGIATGAVESTESAESERSARVSHFARRSEPEPEPVTVRLSTRASAAAAPSDASEQLDLQGTQPDRALVSPHRSAPPANLEHGDAAQLSLSGLLAQHDQQSEADAEKEDQLLSAFFSSPPIAALDSDPPALPMSAGSRRAMWASLAIFGVSLLGIGGYTAYQQWIMPAPVELGGSAALDLPPPTLSRQPTAANASAYLETSFAPSPDEVAASGADKREPSTQPAATTETTVNAASAPEVAETKPAASAAQLAVTPQPGTALASPESNGASHPNAHSPLDPQPTAAALPLAPTPSAAASNAQLGQSDFDAVISVAREFAHKRQSKRAKAAFDRALELRPNDAYRKCATDAVGSYVNECRNLAR